MKQFFSSLLLSSLAFLTSTTQSFAQVPAGFKTGYVITAEGNRLEGYIKESFKSKASFVFQSTDGKKTSYVGNDIKEAGINGVVYISYLSDFFKVISSGNKVSLYQKVSDASGKVIYNGAEVVGINPGTEGAINDHFIKTTGADNMMLVNKKNFEQVVTAHCADCPNLVESVKTDKVNYEEIEKAVQLYNECK
ncbi:MAG: hypothetical protein SGI83_13145 [Bacteroidota bacterium]|nr:hypothetical protein [Bacteroidota bacterium]